ncbi:unnamed protein product [Brassica oleracea var. botrytis]
MCLPQSRCGSLSILNNGKLKGITHLPLNVLWVNVSYSGIEKMPDCVSFSLSKYFSLVSFLLFVQLQIPLDCL